MADQALIQAVMKNDVEGAKKALGERANPNAMYNGHTALMLAAGNGYTGVTKALLDAGADWQKSNASGETALAIALKLGRLDDIKLLIQKGADIIWNNREELPGVPYNLFSYQAERPDAHAIGRMHWMLQNKVVDGPDAVLSGERDQQRTALMVAKDPEIVRFLISAGADVNKEDYDGKSVLEYALESNQPIEKLKMLLEAGAKITPAFTQKLAAAIQYKVFTDKAKIQLLLEKGVQLPESVKAMVSSGGRRRKTNRRRKTKTRRYNRKH